jgi:cellulose synthase/poly-beta-1,6-N-acetylglucosamine synthase-like glycosyltransferase
MITNILLTKKGYGRGYLPQSNSSVLQPAFPTANLAFRREVINEIGLFDSNCQTGEDLDMCIRVAKTKWEIFFEPRAVVKHKHRTSFRELIKQWQGYGAWHPYIFKKHSPKCLEICYSDKNSALTWSSKRYLNLMGIPVPMPILIFVTPFHVLNFLLAATLLAALLKLSILSRLLMFVWLLSCAYFLMVDFCQNYIIKNNSRWFIYSLIRYILNWAYVSSAFWGGLKIGVLYFESTREQTPNDKLNKN